MGDFARNQHARILQPVPAGDEILQYDLPKRESFSTRENPFQSERKTGRVSLQKFKCDSPAPRVGV
jgi:hypothetical protein